MKIINIKQAKKTDRSYIDALTGDNLDHIPSITEVCAEVKKTSYINDNMIIGSNIHSYMASTLQGATIEIEDEAEKTLFNKIFENLKKAIIDYDLSFIEGSPSIEVSKWGLIDGNFDDERGIKGTCDLLMQSVNNNKATWVIEYKSGKKHDWHKEQLAVNCLLNNAVGGILIYPDDAVKYDLLSCKTLRNSLNSFENKLNAYYEGNLKDGKIRQSADLVEDNLKELVDLIMQSNRLLYLIKQKKEEIIAIAEPEKNFGNDEIEVFWKKNSIRTELKKEAKQELFQSNPDFFNKTEVSAGFNFKLKNNTNDNN